MLDRKQSELGAGWGSYAVIFLVSSLGSLTITKFNGLTVHCCSSFFSFVRILPSNILSVYYCTWTIYVNVTILRKYSGNGRACASSRYQAVFLLPHGLGTRLLAEKHLQNEDSLSRKSFKLAMIVRDALADDPGRNRKALSLAAKKKVKDSEAKQRLSQVQQLPKQGEMIRPTSSETVSVGANPTLQHHEVCPQCRS